METNRPTLETASIAGKLDLFFRFLWVASLLLLVANLNYVFGLGNVNWIERSLFLVAAIIFVAKNPIANKFVIIGFVILMMSILILGYFSEFSEFSWGRVAGAIAALIAILLFFMAIPNQSERVFMLQTIALITPVLVLTGFAYMLIIGRPIFSFDHTGALRYRGGTIPAFIAAAGYTSSIIYSMLFRHTKEFKYLFLILFCLLVCVLSGSRMPTVCATICIFAIVLTSLQSTLTRATFVLSGIFVGVLGLVTVGEQLILRFTSHSTSGRDAIWNAVLSWAERYPWTGVGFGHHHLLIPDTIQKITGTRATHNEYVRLFAELGYVGAITFALGLFMIYYFSSMKKSFSDVVVTLVFLTTYLLYSYSDNTLTAAYCLLAPLGYALSTGLAFKNEK